MPVTSRLALPYPASNEAANIPLDMQELADALDLKVAIYAYGTAAARPVTGTSGQLYRATDTGVVSFWDTAWRDVTSPAGLSGTLASRPTAASKSGGFYLATDQDVLYFSNGTTWLRTGMPAGATTRVYSNTVPTGWISYDGVALPASTGIYADLYAALGNTTATPDTRERILVSKGSHVDVDTLGDNDNLAYGSRSPVHNSTFSLAATSHDHGGGNHAHTHGLSGGAASGPGSGTAVRAVTASVAYTDSPAYDIATQVNGSINGSGAVVSAQAPTVSGSVGPGGATRPSDKPGFITFSVVLAKL